MLSAEWHGIDMSGKAKIPTRGRAPAPSHHTGAPRSKLVVADFKSRCLEQFAEEAGAIVLVTARVDAVDGNQLASQLNGIHGV